MPPPPKPPVICYDLQTNTNARRTPCSRYRVSTIVGASCKPKVTLIPTEDSAQPKTDTCWHHSYEHEADDENEQSQRPPTRYRSIYHTRLQENTQSEPPRKHSNIHHQHQTTTMTDYPRKHKTLSFASTLPSTKSTVVQTRGRQQQQVRYEYDQKLKEKLRQKEHMEERKRQEEAMKAELDAITLKLESVKRVHENLEHTYGMSHNAARYFQKTDEDYANLKRKLDQFAQIRSKDAERQLQEKKKLYKLQQQEDRQVELRRLRDMSRLAHNKHSPKLTSTLNGSLSPSSQTPSSSSISNSTRNSPSSTISISTCSSPMSSTEELLPQYRNNSLSHNRHNSHLVAETTPNKSLNRNRRVSSSTPSTSRIRNSPRLNSSILKTQAKRPLVDFSFYKGPSQDDGETLDVTDLHFLEKIEDKTMLEVNELLDKMQSVLGDSYDEQHLLNNNNNTNCGDISQLRSQVDNLAIRPPEFDEYYNNQSYFQD